ncbi:MarR family winged helix-turn-helix transcriptional regulator [Fodinicola feengrottensis]|uniref:MarR family transcriptional regulator n=1 Tax=Fodinicola feengrottensis TaxID=435914 RepID=A0ABN2HU73_9ACTN|nr:MarR family transcriptional regulator [Fodinicola feengrottensis]
MQANQFGEENAFAQSDHVDRVLAQWARQWPELDTSPVAVIARVGRVREFFDRGMEELFAQHGLTRQAWDVLACVRRAGSPYELTPSELSAALMRTSGAVTHTLQRLEYDGLIERVASETDLRSLLVRLSPAGKALVDEVAPRHVANEKRMLAALTDDEQTAFADMLRRLLLSFEEADSAVRQRRR